MTRRSRILATLCLTAACVRSGEPSGPPYRAHILAEDSIDPDTGKGSFSIAPRALHHVVDFNQLSGPLYRFYRGGEARIRVSHGSIVVDGSFDHGKAPDLRYVVEHGVAVPRDYPTLIMLSAAYQFELVFDALEAHTGYSADALTERLGRLRVFFEPTIVETGDGSSARVSIKRNAFFDPSGNIFGLARRSSAEDVPLAADPKVIAHEMGHAVFFLAFADATIEKCDPERAAENAADPFFPGRFDLEYVISGLNEGFADFHSFAIHGSQNPLANFGDAGDERSLTGDDYVWDDLEKEALLTNDACEGSFYCVGTLFARSLYEALTTLGFDPHNDTDRAEFMRAVVGAVAGTRTRLYENADLPPAEDAISACNERKSSAVIASDGPLAGAFFEAFLAGLPADFRVALCPALIARFGDRGFPDAYRSACAP